MASPELFNYCPESVVCLLGGILPVEGFVAGTFISVTKDTMPFSTITMPDGTTARRYVNNQTYTITISLHKGSASNDVLTKFWQLDEISQRGKFPLLIKDSSGSDLFFSTTTWIDQLPSMNESLSVDERAWVLRSSQGVINIGGNADPSSIIEDLINVALSAIPALEGVI